MRALATVAVTGPARSPARQMTDHGYRAPGWRSGRQFTPGSPAAQEAGTQGTQRPRRARSAAAHTLATVPRCQAGVTPAAWHISVTTSQNSGACPPAGSSSG